MRLFSSGERKILNRFVKRSEVKTEYESRVLERCASVGFVNFGFDWDTMTENAMLTESGIVHKDR